MTTTAFEVTDAPPEWSRPGRRKISTEKYFYVHADTRQGWPHQADTTLCKFGVTDDPWDRCDQNTEKLQDRWGIRADLKVVFVATGTITNVEKEVVDHTLRWLPDGFEKNAEWRRCRPRQLARIAVLIAERRFRSGYV
jgi:hypothetical protein